MTLPSAAVWMLCQIVTLLGSVHPVPFGQRTLAAYVPEGDPSHFVILLADDPAAMLDVVADLRRNGAATVVVDATAYLADAAQGGRSCTLADVDFEALAKVSQKTLLLPAYRPAELVGVGRRSAALAYIALAQAPGGTFAGAVSVGFCPELETPAPFCHQRGIAGAPRAGAASSAERILDLIPTAKVADPWTVVGGGSCGDAAAQSFSARIASAHFAAAVSPAESSVDVVSSLTAAAGPGRGSRAAATLPDLPLREIGAAAPAAAADTKAARAAARAAADSFVVMVSGDGGWLGFDREIGHALGRLGVPVVGIDSLRYFWLPRSPDEVGHDLTRVVETYLAAWGKRRVILAGYSQGADVIPFMAAGLSPELRQRVALVALVGPDPRADFEVDLAGWFAGAAPPPEQPVLPELARLRGLPLLCVYGAREEHSLCPSLQTERVTILRMASTGHYYGGHGTEIADSILEAANGLASGRPPRPASPVRAHRAVRSANAG